jgi:hypothetical protein
MKTKEVTYTKYECDNCGSQYDMPEDILTCEHCKKEVCEACSSTVWSAEDDLWFERWCMNCISED